MTSPALDAVVVGSGPNGLAAALVLAAAGLSVEVLEAQPTLGGGSRTLDLTLPGFRNDLCSAVHPMAVASPFYRALDLDRRGIEPAAARGGVRPAAGRRARGHRVARPRPHRRGSRARRTGLALARRRACRTTGRVSSTSPSATCARCRATSAPQ
ncbi:hypothetical protein GCM10025868_13750 [Angustibacter aerolatus]|uniref:FAD-dependent oxidoreductase 2 FAD binding domain-containing protein n=1 Tax=Angustibacter aerolatus TaxID=1162965 RepID=A0ABQ6JH03_9ACTN|nr:FAD-dependent oxidoreductase [Angustibacter aerolatus]GMA86125.1 hypothetical protein GCM10025868_13750 [Angustibacter aerolatus]